MSLSLIGIIFVQAYFINNSVQNEKKRFVSNVKKTLYNVSNTLEKREYAAYVHQINKMLTDDSTSVDISAVRDLYIVDNRDEDETVILSYSMLEENLKFNSPFFDISLDNFENDSLSVKKVYTEKETQTYRKNTFDDALSTSQKLHLLDNISSTDKILYEDLYKDLSHKRMIHQRVSVEELNTLLSDKFRQDSIKIGFEFAVYSKDLATKIKSADFEFDKASTFEVPFFPNKKNPNPYRLLVNFPNDSRHILSSIYVMIILSIIFTSIIIIAYSSALYQLVKQRKISQIKTDFINNMTHEFKTPIATINLALDAIKNPKIIEDKNKVVRYLNMIKEENKRMHAQVENVLRISKLEKNELNISKDRVDLHDIIDVAISHVELIVEDRQGYIKKHLEAEQNSVLANDMHFTNVIVNILDNAIKYSPDVPKIDVYTENIGTNILLKIQDQGSGMSKAAVKRVFEKFYREHTGNIHNVKGHGLGLAYVKRIIDDHQGFISVESEKDKGSIFTIKLPLIS